LEADIIVNCVGVLQDSLSVKTDQVHREFVGELAAFCAREPKKLLIHISIAGDEQSDASAFSRSKRAGEALICASGAPYVILRPGFVIAHAAYGGSALMRAAALLPIGLPASLAQQPLAVTDMEAISATMACVVGEWRNGRRQWAAKWDVMEQYLSRVGQVVELFRSRLGGRPPTIQMPEWLLRAGALIGDATAILGWRPPLRSTAISELRRGVAGDPSDWIRHTRISPPSVVAVLTRLPSTVQEKWFARLYLWKPVMLAILVVFWIASGLVPLLISLDAATSVLMSRGVGTDAARIFVVLGSIADIVVGCAIAMRSTCRVGLIAGMALAAGYLIGGTVVAPELWADPLGALLKVLPVFVLMLISLAVLDNR
jgi:hypothetical protein